MILLKSPRAGGKTRWLAQKTKKYPKGTTVYYVSPTGAAHDVFLERMRESGLNPNDYHLALLNPRDLSYDEWYEELVNDMDTAVFYLDDVSALVSQCNARQLLVLSVMMMSDDCYVTDTKAAGLATITDSRLLGVKQ